MWIPESSVKTLVDNISEIIKYKHHLVAADVRKKLEELKTQLEKLRLLMPNFFENQGHGSRLDIKKTVKEITEILQGCEDAVDYVFSCCRCHTHRSTLDRMFLTDTQSRRSQISKGKRQIQEAGSNVKHITEEIVKKGYQVLHAVDRAIVNLDPGQSFPTVLSSAPKIGGERVIGFSVAVAEVVELLTTGAKHFQVISIVGMLGTGKTTLAKMVYNNHEVQSQYMIRGFVSVTRDFDTTTMLYKILSSFTQGAHEPLMIVGDELVKHVYKQLEGKQYLIILDDVWEEMEWDKLKDAFPDNGDLQSRVLVTTRFNNVAEHANRRDSKSLYRLKFLSPESSMELLRWRIFGENRCPMELREHESDIVIKCQGFPLALLSAASMLVKHLDQVEWWKKVAETLSDDPTRDVQQTTKSIKLAYMHLPNHLKPCLLYFDALNTTENTPVWKLLRLWISEGFILEDEESEYRSLEDIAEQYLEELVDRNFVMVLKRRSNGRIRICNINSTFSKFCKSRAAKENLVSVFKPSRNIDPIMYNVRRIAIDDDISTDNLGFLSDRPTKGANTRSFLMLSNSRITLDFMETGSCIIQCFKLLKVLDAESLFFNSLPAFGSLVLLKFVAISGFIISLPSTLFDLWSLQTLIVQTTWQTLEINADISKMPHFRHLHTNATANFPCKSQKTGESVSNARTLCYISPECCKKEVFQGTRKLRKLGIRGTLTELFEPSLLENLHKLKYLENLKLMCNGFPGRPIKISFPKQLTKLTLSNTHLNWKDMRTVGELGKLEVLKLKHYAFLGVLWKTENGGFLHLKHLHIGDTDLIVWEATSDDFPQLQSLEISGYMYQLRRIPRSMADIQSLQSIRLHSRASPGMVYSLKRIRLIKFLQANIKTFEISILHPQTTRMKW